MMAAASSVRAETLLDLADRGEGTGVIDRALTLAEVAGADPERLRTEPLGRLHAAVLEFRAAFAGPRLDSVATCPNCGAVVEFALDVEALLALGDDHPEQSERPARGSFTFVPDATGTDPLEVRWRAPSAADVQELAGTADAAAALRARCVEVIGPDGSRARTLPDALINRLEGELSGADPLAELLVSLDCPECGAGFDADLDPAGFVWAEVEARARRVLIEVDALARAYGWTEAEVLALSDARRAAYLSIVWDGAG
jgi:hypothetical protein